MPPRRKTPISPRRVFKKVAACRFFLEQMQQHEDEENEFTYCLSAFLAALQSVAWLTPMADPKLRSEIDQLVENHPDLKYLLNARHAELHRDGVSITMSFGSSLGTQPRGFRFPSSRFHSRFEGRLARSRFHPLWAQSIYQPRYCHTWRFRDYPMENILQICRDCLDILEALVARTFPRAALLAGL